MTSFVPLCRRWTKKRKALSKNAYVRSVVNTTQLSRQKTLTRERAMGMKMKATMKKPQKMKMKIKKTKNIASRWSLFETAKLMKLFTSKLICILCYTLYARCKLT